MFSTNQTFFLFHNECYTRKFLQKTYEKAKIEKAKERAYQNTDLFCAFIRHAQTFFQHVQTSAYAVQPLLLYYGMMNMWKAFLLTIDPDYPQNSAVLQHGISTRKKKKAGYRFFQDEIRLQKEGLVPALIRHFQLPLGTGDVYQVWDLLQMIPGLQQSIHLFEQVNKKKSDDLLAQGNHRRIVLLPPELAYYFLMFSLGMLSRYDPLLWWDLVEGNTSEEAILITLLLQQAGNEFPPLAFARIMEAQSGF
jgi:hypothetical protein